MAKPTLTIVIASTRPGRAGLPIGQWFEKVAREHGGFEVQVADLAEINLPLMDEPKHPRLRDYQHEHTKKWSELVDGSDAFVFVLPEYNFGFPASIKNALDYLWAEWNYKPLGFVSYGGASGGMRAVQALKPIASTLKLHPITEQVALHGFAKHLEDGEFVATEDHEAAAKAMLEELQRVEGAMRPLRS
ncbi:MULTISPECIES: NADPH-dependent FMN reductase [Micrococcaceae]|uniref:NADPH-dependent FMN reductase n=1 Tax=Pseudoglutamicibacter albus DNF00011 TaxID=1401063 RepID=A0A095YC47_9MICC|nr:MULTISPECIES: NAD(P)H-dependent oxidoreductase [Micrococcaceae]KGF20035.1 NADPH-dependent FMN reductase [Pseudoglutamicibacter albus DNF00011]